jgi:hypothetical protein
MPPPRPSPHDSDEQFDKLAINETLNRYWYGVGRHDLDAVMQVFTSDARCGAAHGILEIRASLEGISRLRYINIIRGSQQILVHGDEADADTQAVAFVVPELGPPGLSIESVRYIDHLVRTDEGWKIRSRTGRIDLTSAHDIEFAFDLAAGPATWRERATGIQPEEIAGDASG